MSTQLPKDLFDRLSERLHIKSNKKTILKIFLIVSGILVFMITTVMMLSDHKDEKKLVKENNNGYETEPVKTVPALMENTNLPNSVNPSYKLTPEVEQQTVQKEKSLIQAKLLQLRESAPIQMYSIQNNAKSVSANLLNPFSTENKSNLLKPETSNLFTSNSLNSFNMNSKGRETDAEREASAIKHPEYTVLQGTLINAVLQTAINSDLPGMVKAVVNQDVYSATGDYCLIPRGSILIGQYNSQINQGQKRILIIWQRLINPQMQTIILDSPATDTLGRSGLMADAIDNHFWQRFSEAALFSIISAGVSNIGNQDQSAITPQASYQIGVANSFQQTAGNTLQQNINIKPTLTLSHGSLINVFTNHDLSFFNVWHAKDIE